MSLCFSFSTLVLLCHILDIAYEFVTNGHKPFTSLFNVIEVVGMGVMKSIENPTTEFSCCDMLLQGVMICAKRI